MRKAFHFEFAVEAEQDFGLISDHLLYSYLEFSGQDHVRHMIVRVLAE